MWATEDELLEQQVKLQGGKFSKHQQGELDELLQKWKSVLKETPGETSIATGTQHRLWRVYMR